jgi:hypothetical protein
VNGQVSTVYTQVWQVDAAPTSSQRDAVAAIEHDGAEVMKLWETFKTSDLSSLNRQLRGASLSEIKIEPDLRQAEPQTDEE